MEYKRNTTDKDYSGDSFNVQDEKTWRGIIKILDIVKQIERIIKAYENTSLRRI